MNEFTDFYRRQAALAYARMRQCSENADVNGFTVAELDFKTYRAAAGLPENWKPDDENHSI